jgi:hypothetical protein
MTSFVVGLRFSDPEVRHGHGMGDLLVTRPKQPQDVALQKA